jgi:hypothetical protein
VDTTELRELLDGIESDAWTTDTINDLIEQKLSNDGYVTDQDVKQTVRDELDGQEMDEDRVQEIFRDMAHNEGEAMVEGLIDDRGYLTSDDVDTKLGDYVTGDDLQRKVDEAIESTGFENQVGTLANELKTLTEDFNVQVKALEDKLAAVIEGHNIVANRVNALEERDDTAMDFFKLIKQAFALLRP